MDPVIALYQRDVDISLLKENLKKSPEERILALANAVQAIEELRRATETAKARAR